MEDQTVKSKKNSQRGSQIKVVANWQYSEVTPSFKKLMLLLLKNKESPNGKDTIF